LGAVLEPINSDEGNLAATEGEECIGSSAQAPGKHLTGGADWRQGVMWLQVLAQLEQDPAQLQRCGLGPAELPALVEHNPAVAVEARRCPCSCHSAPK
jgi:hypothetical protein